jgi:hypothetical protein
VRAIVAEDARQFIAFLTREVAKAQECGELDGGVEAAQIAFELDALGAAAQSHVLLTQDPAVFDRAERAIQSRIDALAP